MISLKAMMKQVDMKRAKVARLNVQLKEANAAKLDAETDLIDYMIKENMKSTTRDAATGGYTLKQTNVPSVVDWGKLDAYILRYKALDMLQRRVSSTAWRERMEAGKKVPGIDVYTKYSLTKVK